MKTGHTERRVPCFVTAVSGLILILVLGLGTSACAGDDGDRTVTVYSGRNQDLVGPVLELFAEETGIDVRVRYAGSAELALLIREEGGQSPADVFISQSPGPVAFLADLDLLARLSDEVLELGPHSDGGEWVALTGRQRVLVYNTEKVAQAELPESIFELTEPAWTGRVALAPGNGSFQDFVTLFRLEHGNEVAADWLRAMIENDVQIYGNNSGIVQAVARGEVDAGLVNHYYHARLKVEDPDTLSENHLLRPGDPGSVTIATAASALRSGDRELADSLIRFLLGAEGQTYFATKTLEYPLGSGIGETLGLELPDTLDLGEFDRLGGGLEGTLELIREAGFGI